MMKLNVQQCATLFIRSLEESEHIDSEKKWMHVEPEEPRMTSILYRFTGINYHHRDG